jgi:predicted MFS family arabinose efflux permease
VAALGGLLKGVYQLRVTNEVQPAAKESRAFLLATLTLGHGIAHFYQQSFLVLLPRIATDLGLGGVGVGALGTVRHATSFSIEAPGGFIVDMLKRRWGLILAGCMGLIAVAWAVAGVAPNFPILIIAVILIALPGTVWHCQPWLPFPSAFQNEEGSPFRSMAWEEMQATSWGH